MLEQRPNLNDIIDHEIVMTESVESTSENKVEQSPSSLYHRCEKCDYQTNSECDLKTICKQNIRSIKLLSAGSVISEQK